MKNFAFLFAVLILGFTACKNETASDADAGAVQEIQQAEGADNAALVRNPASATEPGDTVNVAKMIFDAPEYNFGEAKQGAVVEHAFKFKNTGKVPLVIMNARSTCGCTVPEWPKEAIAPGAVGEISARFNTEGKAGNQNKVITVTANTYPSETTVAIIGDVNAPEVKK